MTQKTVHKYQLLFFTSGRKVWEENEREFYVTYYLLFECEGGPAQITVIFFCISISSHQLPVCQFGSL